METSIPSSNLDGLLPPSGSYMVQTTIVWRDTGPTSVFENPIKKYAAVAENGGPVHPPLLSYGKINVDNGSP
jgi:hypothetical protein